MRYVYSAILYEDDGKVGISVPDLPGCHTYGEEEADGLFMAQDVIAMWLWDAEKTGLDIPKPFNNLEPKPNERITLVAADTNEYRGQQDTMAIKKTLSIPAWLNHKAEAAN